MSEYIAIVTPEYIALGVVSELASRRPDLCEGS